MDTFDVDSYEIDLWSYLQLLSQKKYLILTLVLICLTFSFFVSVFFTKEEYQSEMWIYVNKNVLIDREEIPLEYIEAYLDYPEVLSVALLGSPYDIYRFKDKINLTKMNDIIRVTLRHFDNTEINKILERWIVAMELKLILDVGTRRLAYLENDQTALTVNLDMMEKKFLNIQELLSIEGQHKEIEVVQKDSSNPKPFIFKELNPSYVELNNQANELQIVINELVNRQSLLEKIETDYRLVLKDISRTFETGNLNLTELANKLKHVQENYTAYSQWNDPTAKVSLMPIQIVSKPIASKEPVYPNVTFNIIIAGMIGLFLGIFLTFFSHYVKEMRIRDKEISM